jgi:dTDP-glucose pyrophosphorylase/predicted transcriptional regulator
MNVSQEKYLISIESSIQDAIASMNESSKRIALVVDSQKTLLGVITDSDIRRLVLSHTPLTDLVRDTMIQKPIIGFSWDTDQEILNLMKEHDIYQIPILDNLNRVVELKTINNILSQEKNTINSSVVLMAGGLGTRLYPITQSIPKPLVPINGKPILRIIIDNLMEKGFSKLHVSINYKGEMIREELKRDLKYSSISYIEESERLGTAGALSLFEEKFTEPLLVQNADILTTLDYQSMLKFHNENNNAITIAVRREKIQIPYGVVTLDGSTVKKIQEKPEQYYFANVGIYVISPDILKRIPFNQYYDMPTLIEDCLNDGVHVGSFPVHEYWADIGQIDELEKARSVYSEIFN